MKSSRSDAVSARAFAKVNLGLEVLRKRDDGYHELRTILQTVDLFDELRFEPAPEGIRLTTSDPHLSTGPDNLVHRAASLVADRARERSGVAIHLEKRIPAGMGLGGGSADAAMTLLALDRLWAVGLDTSELHDMAASIGMDVPFFLYGGTALGVGRGDEVFPLGVDFQLSLVLVLPRFEISTAETYRRLTLTTPATSLTLRDFSWSSSRVLDRLGKLVNHLEAATGQFADSILSLKRRLTDHGAVAAMMSGSGSAVFGAFDDRHQAERAAEELRREDVRAVATETLTRAEYRRRRFPDEALRD